MKKVLLVKEGTDIIKKAKLTDDIRRERERERERAGKVTFEAPFAAKQVSLHSHVSLCIFSPFVYLYLDLLR